MAIVIDESNALGEEAGTRGNLINSLRAIPLPHPTQVYNIVQGEEAAPSIDGEGRARLREYFIAIGNLEGVNLNTGMGHAAATPRRDEEEICG